MSVLPSLICKQCIIYNRLLLYYFFNIIFLIIVLGGLTLFLVVKFSMYLIPQYYDLLMFTKISLYLWIFSSKLNVIKNMLMLRSCIKFIIALCRQKQKKHLGPIWNTSPLRRANPERNAGTVHKSNPEQVLVFKAPRGTIQKSNPEHLLVIKATRGDNPRVQSGTPPCF